MAANSSCCKAAFYCRFGLSPQWEPVTELITTLTRYSGYKHHPSYCLWCEMNLLHVCKHTSLFLHFQGLKTGSLHFPGTASSYQGEVATIREVEPLGYNYKNETAWRKNTDKVMRWFRDEDLDFISFYFGEPDGTGHLYGPDSPQRRKMVEQVDRTVGYIRHSAEQHGLSDRLNIIITADHGMSTVYRKDQVEEIILRKIPGFSFKDLSFHLVDYGPSGMLLPKPGKLETVYKALKGAHPHLHVYKKEEMPEHLHFSKNDRILPIVLWADPGYLINGVCKAKPSLYLYNMAVRKSREAINQIKRPQQRANMSNPPTSLTLGLARNETCWKVSTQRETCSSSFLHTACPIDLPFKVNTYLRLPFGPRRCAELPSAALK